jgi:hypothetical protein
LLRSTEERNEYNRLKKALADEKEAFKIALDKKVKAQKALEEFRKAHMEEKYNEKDDVAM